jgi:release factor glutamine methyltransferase
LNPETVGELLFLGARFLKSLPDPALEARLLLMHAASLDEKSVLTEPGRRISAPAGRDYLRMLRRRLDGWPAAYLTGRKEFWSMPFRVGPGVLIPRPETESLVEKVVEIAAKGRKRILDLGTGSGNVAVALARELPRADITASDISVRALKIASRNAQDNGCPGIRFLRGDLFSSFDENSDAFDVIASNPPYVDRKSWERLPAEIRDHEPSRALIGGESGLEVLCRIIRRAPRFLRPGGSLVLEIGAGQKDAVLSGFGDDWEGAGAIEDLAGIPRVVFARRPVRRRVISPSPRG